MGIKDLFFPKSCLACGVLGSYICLNCQKQLMPTEQERCLYCGRSSFVGYTHPVCFRRFGVDGLIAAFRYNNTLKKIIKNIKYRLVFEAFNEVLQLITQSTLLRLNYFVKSGDLIIQPIPLHPKKLRERGFNQSATIADFISRFYPLKKDQLLIRKKETAPQAQFKHNHERYKNLLGAFTVTNTVALKNILLVDDVVTTGSTVKEATRILKRAGARRVFVFTLAKG
jgi:competence protein ComFC